MNSTSVVGTATKRETVGKKTKTEMTIKLQESPASMGNAKTVGKEDTGLLIVGRGKEKIETMTSTTYLWDSHSVDKYNKRTIKKIPKNGYVIAAHHHISLTRRKT